MLTRFNRLLPWSLPVVLIVAYIWSSIAATAATQTAVGEIADVQGRGWGISEWGRKYDKLGGDLVSMDEVVATGTNSAMTMHFIDKTTMTLGENAELTIDEMVYNPENDENDTVTIRLGKGSFYFVSGLVAKEKVTIITPTASIGIRGTELVIDVAEDGSTSVGVAKGHAFLRSKKKGGRSVEVEVGNTARINNKGKISDPFPGIDLTGEEDVDRKIPGVAEWLDEDDKEKDEDDLTEFANHTLDHDDDEADEDVAKNDDDDEDDEGDDDEIASKENDDDDDDESDESGDDGDDGDEGSDDDGDDGSDDGGEGSDDGGDDGGEGSDDGGDDGNEGDDHDRENDRGGRDGKRDRDRH